MSEEIELSSAEYEQLRNEVLERDNYECKYCDVAEPIADLEAHHILRLEDGGTNTADNLVTLCIRCHRSLHRLVDEDHRTVERLEEIEKEQPSNKADTRILKMLEDGRASPTMIADETDYARQYVHSRLKLLVDTERVRKAGHGVYELEG